MENNGRRQFCATTSGHFCGLLRNVELVPEPTVTVGMSKGILRFLTLLDDDDITSFCPSFRVSLLIIFYHQSINMFRSSKATARNTVAFIVILALSLSTHAFSFSTPALVNGRSTGGVVSAVDRNLVTLAAVERDEIEKDEVAVSAAKATKVPWLTPQQEELWAQAKDINNKFWDFTVNFLYVAISCLIFLNLSGFGYTITKEKGLDVMPIETYRRERQWKEEIGRQMYSQQRSTIASIQMNQNDQEML